MKKSVKKGLIISGSVVCFLLISLVTIPLLFKEKIKDVVVEKINNRLNADLSIKDFGINVFSNFPNITLSLQDMAISGIYDFTGDTLMQAKSLDVTLSLSDILKGDYVVKKINLDEANVYAKTLADGRANWDIIKPDSLIEDTGNNIDSLSDETNKGILRLKKISLNHCNVIYEDQSINTKVLLNDWNGSLSGDIMDSNTTLKTNSSIEEVSLFQNGIPYLSKAKGKLDATINIDINKYKLTFVESVFQINDLKASLDGSLAFVGDEGKDFDLKLSCPNIEFKSILSLLPAIYTDDFKDIQTQGEVSLSGYIKGLMEGEMYPAFDLKILIENAMFKYPSLPKSINDINVGINIYNKEGSLDNMIIDVKKFNFSIGGNPFSASLNIQTPLSDANIKAQLKGVIDLGMIKDVYPIDKETVLSGHLTSNLNISARMSAIDKEQYQNIIVNGSLSVDKMTYKGAEMEDVFIDKASLDFNPQTVTLSSLDLKIGKNDLSANGKLQNFIPYLLNNKTIKGQLNIKSDYFNLNNFVSTTSNQSDTSTENGDHPSNIDNKSNSSVFIVPTNIDFVLNADMKRVIYGKTDITNLRGTILIKDGIAKLQNVSANMFGGTTNLSGSYNTASNPESPQLDMSLNLSKASFSETFKSLESVQKLAPVFEKIAGNYSLNMSLNTIMDGNIGKMLSSLSASGSIKSNDVKVEGVKALDELSSSLKVNSLKVLSAKDINVLFVVKDGKVETKPFSINIGDGGKLNLEGVTGLDQTINYKGTVTLPKDLANAYINNIPLTITGTFTNPKVSVNTKSMLGDIAEQLLGGAKNNNGTNTSSTTLADSKQEQIDKIRLEAKEASDKIVEEADKAGKNLIDAADSKGPLAKLAAEKAAQKLNEEAKKNAKKILDSAEDKINKL